MALEIRRAAPDDDLSKSLMAELWTELSQRYADDPTEPDPEPERTGETDDLQLHQLQAPSGVFLVVSDGAGERDQEGGALACGGIRRHDEGVGEIKRMYVRAAARGKGVGRTLLAALESEARRLGYHALVLETGLRQPEAITLYESDGYVPIPSYGYFKDSELSRCYGKELGAR